MSRNEIILVQTWAACFAFTLGGILSSGFLEEAWENDAVKRGFAEYYIDRNFSKQWRWIEPQGDLPKREP